MGASGFDKDAMCSVVFRRFTDVPSVSGMFAPGALVTGFDMELYRASDGRKWHSVIVKRSVVIGVCRDLGDNICIAQ